MAISSFNNYAAVVFTYLEDRLPRASFILLGTSDPWNFCFREWK